MLDRVVYGLALAFVLLSAATYTIMAPQLFQARVEMHDKLLAISVMLPEDQAESFYVPPDPTVAPRDRWILGSVATVGLLALLSPVWRITARRGLIPARARAHAGAWLAPGIVLAWIGHGLLGLCAIAAILFLPIRSGYGNPGGAFLVVLLGGLVAHVLAVAWMEIAINASYLRRRAGPVPD